MLRSKETYEAGFQLLVRDFQHRLYRHIRRVVGTHEDADDVLQNTMIKVHRGIKSFRGDSSLYTWLFRIATREAVSMAEKNRRRTTLILDDQRLKMTDTLMADPYFNGDILLAQLATAVGTLPPKQRAVFCMRYYDAMSYARIAEILNTSEGALKASFHHAAKKVERYILQQSMTEQAS